MFKPLEPLKASTPSILSNAPNPEENLSLEAEVLSMSEDSKISYCEEVRSRILKSAKEGTPSNISDNELAKAILIKTLALSPSPYQDIEKISKPLKTKSAPSKPRAVKAPKEPKEPKEPQAQITLPDF